MSTPRTRLDRQQIITELHAAFPYWVEWTSLRWIRWLRLRGELTRCERALSKLPVKLFWDEFDSQEASYFNVHQKLLLDVAGDMDALIRGFREEWE